MENTKRMKVRNKEYQSLGLKELKKLSYDFPNDAALGNEIRKIIRESEPPAPKDWQEAHPF